MIFVIHFNTVNMCSVISSSQFIPDRYVITGFKNYSRLYTNTSMLVDSFKINNILTNNITDLHKRVLVSASNLNPSIVSSTVIGRSYTAVARSWYGNIWEIIVYDSTLNNQETQLVNQYLIDKYTPRIDIGSNILRRYSLCDTTLRTTKMYESYLWSTGDTTREITIAKEDTGWYWCEVPNLFGDIMRDSVYVYNLLPQQNFQQRTICYGDSLIQTNSYGTLSSGASAEGDYSFLWQDANTSDTLVTAPTLQLSSSQLRTLVPSYPHTLVLSIKDTLGCQITDTLIIKIDSFSIQASLGNDKSLCTGDKIGLQTQASKATQWNWNTGSQDSLITIDTAGIYSLQATDSNGCIANDSINISIKGITPIVGYIADTVCRTDSTLFTDTSYTLDASSITQWIWEYGDTSSPTHQFSNSPTRYLYTDSGTYTTKLTVSTDSGCTNYAYKNIYIRPLPQPNFSPLTGCQNLNIQLNNNTISSGGTIANNLWIINSQDSLLAPSPTRQFASSGYQDIKLITTDQHGCTDSITKQVYVKPSPIANFQYSIACEGERIYFNDSSNLPLSNHIIEQKWWFNNNQDSSIAATPSFQFDSSAYWPTSYYLKSANGCWDTITKSVAVHPFITADFNYLPLCVDNESTFFGANGFSSSVPAFVKSMIWLVDGQYQSNKGNLIFTFTDTLEHDIRYIVESTAGCVDSIEKSVKINPLPTAKFTADRQYGLPPLQVDFENLSTDNVNNIWYFEQGQYSNLENPIYTFMDSSIYNVILDVENQFGCHDSSSMKIYAIYAAIDIEIKSIKAMQDGDNIIYSLSIINNGQRAIKKINFEAGINNNYSLSEIWEGNLLKGQTLNYNFKARQKLQNLEDFKYYCISATPITIDKQEDENPDNNQQCKQYSDNLWIGNIYPNPVKDQLNFDFILPYNQEIRIEIYHNQGSKILETSIKGQRGLNKNSLQLPPNLPNALYYLKIISDDKVVSRGFVVGR